MKGASGIYPMIFRRMFFLLAVFTPRLAQAHPGLPGHTHGFANGLHASFDRLGPFARHDRRRPMGGASAGRALWMVPLAFVSVMTLGGMLGMAGMGQIPLIEQGLPHRS
jgi:urease accessory protein